MSVVRLGAVGYLNARPLVYGLDARSDRFSLRFDVPSHCASLLHRREIDVGMIPSVEFLRGPEPYRIVPDLGIVSDGPVASVALFTRVPIERVRSIACDTSSRTSASLTQVLCREAWHITPSFQPMPPDARAMAGTCDAALLIGDPALFFDNVGAGLEKIDLGEVWTRLTGLPFVWAFWAGRPDAVRPRDVDALQAARDAGVAASDALAAEYRGPERAALCQAYLRDNIKYRLGPRESQGLRRFYELAATQALVGEAGVPEFY